MRVPGIVKWLGRAGLASGGLLAGVLAAELTLRTTEATRLPLGVPGLAGRAGFSDRAEGFRFSFNRLGYRSEEFSAAKDPDELRIAIVGDSHTFGFGVDDEDRFSEIVKRATASRTARPLTVLNLGMPGDAFDTYPARAREALKWHPDFLLLVVYTGNDFGELAAAQEKPRAVGPPPTGGSLLRRLHLWHLLAAAVHRVQTPSPIGLSRVGSDRCGGFLRQEEIGPFTQSVFQACEVREQERRARVVRDATKLARGMVAAAQMPVIVACLPSRLLVSPHLGQADAAPVAGRFGMAVAEVLAVERKLQRACVALGKETAASTIDLLVPLRQAPGPAFFPHDWHLNAWGHRIVGQALAEDLLALEQMAG